MFIQHIFVQDDIDSMITRLRAISGRPFGEANPVLDMDLPEFKTRVSVIGDPLSSEGLLTPFENMHEIPGLCKAHKHRLDNTTGGRPVEFSDGWPVIGPCGGRCWFRKDITPVSPSS